MDVFSADKRSWVMQRIKTKDTKPERVVRSALHHLGFRFRLHRKTLPGKPDIVLPRLRKLILVHGCFWHGHPGCRAAARPTTKVEFWNEKLDANIRRDREQIAGLEELGWSVLVLWECETEKPELLLDKLQEFLSKGE
jgi:DNA mismatch endonuclease (patch repair protein)